MRFAVYAGTSVALAAAVVLRALHERANFYSAMVYLAQSNACIMILSNIVLFNVGLVVLGLQRLLYGPLRPIEIEQLYEKAWFAITETCLAMTIFRDELGAWFYILFVSLLIGKVWSWIGEGRVEILEQQPPANPRLFHARLATSLILSIIFDAYFLDYTVGTLREQARPNMIVMFAFEFAVLSVNSVSTCIRYCISLRELAVAHKQVQVRVQERREQLRRERQSRGQDGAEQTAPVEEEIDEEGIDVPGWEEKGRWVFYLDLATDFIRLVLYLTFFCVLCVFYGMPIHIIRDVAITIRSFYKRIADFVKYRQATQDMHARYPDATAQEIGLDNVCIICREPMTVWPAENSGAAGNASPPVERDERLRPKKLPCGHVLHFSCLRSWLERQQNCPTCRQPVLVNTSPRGGTQGVPGAAGGAAAGQQAPAGQNRIRFLNLGPLRLGFGAGPDINRLAQQMQNPQPQNATSAARPARYRLNGQPASLQVHAQIESIEQQLLQEVNSLRIQSQELATVRALVAELARLRALSPGVAPQALQQSAQTTAVPNQPPTIGLPPLSRMQAGGVHVFGNQQAAPQQYLPESLTIPPGWSLVPLQRLNPIPPGAVLIPMGPRLSAQPPASNTNGNAGESGPSSSTPQRAQSQPGTTAARRPNPTSQESGIGRNTTPQAPEVGGPTREASVPSPAERDGSKTLSPQGNTPAAGQPLASESPVSPNRKVDTILVPEASGASSSTARENDTSRTDGVSLPNWRSQATTVEDAEEDD